MREWFGDDQELDGVVPDQSPTPWIGPPDMADQSAAWQTNPWRPGPPNHPEAFGRLFLPTCPEVNVSVTHREDPAQRPRLIVTKAGPADTRLVVLLLPGGRARSVQAARGTQGANLRLIPFARVASRRLRDRPAAVWRLRYRVRGWNEPCFDPVRDTEWALDEVRHRHPAARVALIGHSMGGRTAFRCAGDPSVHGVCAFAPWTEVGEPVAQLSGRIVVIAHGDLDRITDPVLSRTYAERAALAGADVRFEVVAGEGHALLRRAGRWNALVTEFLGLVEAPASR